MKTRKLIICFAMGIILLGTFSCKNARPQDSYSEEQITKMLKNFYTSYLNLYSKHLPLNVEIAKIDSIKKEYCTPKLLNYILSIDELDYDPYLNSQMVDIRMLEALTIKKDEKRNDIYYVSYIYDEKITIKLAVLKEKDGYKIDHIYLRGEKEETP